MTVRITYEIVGLEQLVTKTNAPASLLGPPLRKAFTTSALMVEAESKRLVSVDTSNLRRTITHKVDRAPIPLFAEIGTNSRYARVVHDGRRPGAKPPPISAIAGWASRHGIPVKALYVVARAIGKKGTKGNPFMTNAMRAKIGQINAALTTAARDIEALWGRK